MGKGWKDVGSRLMFNWSQLEQFEQDTSSLSQAAFKMLYRLDYNYYCFAHILEISYLLAEKIKFKMEYRDKLR